MSIARSLFHIKWFLVTTLHYQVVKFWKYNRNMLYFFFVRVWKSSLVHWNFYKYEHYSFFKLKLQYFDKWPERSCDELHSGHFFHLACDTANGTVILLCTRHSKMILWHSNTIIIWYYLITMDTNDF